ncbi:MAG: hypothetical protein ACK4ND_14965 [Cytophagaceae bacterium]
MNKFFLLVFFFFRFFIVNAQVAVNLSLESLFANTTMPGKNPSINSMQIEGIEINVKGPSFEKTYFIPNAAQCLRMVSNNSQREEWLTVDAGLYQRSFGIPELAHSDFTAEIIIHMRSFQKIDFQHPCMCEDDPRWDPKRNCYNTPLGQVCLGGWVGGLDKYCDQKYQVTFTIEPSRKPYFRHTIEGTSRNGEMSKNLIAEKKLLCRCHYLKTLN